MAIDIGPRIGIDGEREFRAAIQNITQQIKTMDSEMGAAAAAFSKEDDIEKKNASTKKILTEQIDAQRKKLEMLQTGLEKATEKYGENDTRTLKWRQSVAEATKSLYKMEGQLDDVENELDDAGDELSEAEKKTSEFGDTAKGVFAGTAIIEGIKAIGGAIKSLVSHAAEAVTSTAELGDTIDKQSQKLGISRTEYQQLAYALDKYGVNVDGLQSGLKTLAVQAQKGSDAFDRLGLSQEFVKSASTEQLFEAVIGKLQGMAEGTERTALANEILGRSATELAPLLNDTAEGFATLKNEAPLMSDATVTASAQMTDSMSAFRSTVTEIKSEVAGRVMPAISKAFDVARQKLSAGDARKAIDRAGQALGNVAGKLVELAARILPVIANIVAKVVNNFGALALAIGGVVLAFNGMRIVATLTHMINAAKTAFAGLNVVMSANPIGAVLSAIGLLIGLLSSLALMSDDAAEELHELSEEEQAVVDAASSARDAFNSGVQAMDASAKAAVDTTQRTKDLWAELETLAGATGRVAEKDKERASIILGQLNDALGTEYAMTGNQIERYQQMKGAIDDVIKAKQASALMDASSGAYQSAVEGRSALEAQLVQDQIAYDNAKQFYEEQEDALAQEIERIKNDKNNKYYGKTDEQIRAHLLSIVGTEGDWRNRINDARDAMNDAEAQYNSTTETLGGMLNTITSYSKAQADIAEGNYDSAIKNLNAINGNLWDAYDTYSTLTTKETDELEKSLNRQSRLVNAYQRANKAGFVGFGNDVLREETTRLDRWQNLYDTRKTSWIRRGADIAESIGTGIAQKTNFARRKAEDVLSGVINAADRASGQSRSAGERVATEFGGGISSFGNRAIENAAELAAEVIRRMDCVGQANKMGQYIARGLADGMSSQQKYVVNKTDQLVNELLFGIRDTAVIRSPSHVTQRFGRYIMQGLPVGMQAELPNALSAVRTMTGTILSAMQLTGPSRAGALAIAGAGGVQGTNYTTNMGGITINMDVSAPNVNNVGELADLVSMRIRDAIVDARQFRR